MKLKLASTTLVLGLMAAPAVPAVAADMISAGPGVKFVPHGAAVPVPAPMPIDNYAARWYFRFDAALGFNDTEFHEKGLVFGQSPAAPGDTGRFRTRPSWFNSSDDVYAGFAAGVGYYFTNRLRGDITVETRGETNFSANNRDVSYTLGGATVDGTYREDSTLRSVPVLFNLYVDFSKHWGFTPYVGGGVGFSVNELVRNVRMDTDGGTFGDVTGRSKKHDVSLAAMFTVGVAYEVDPSWALDFNYRMLYVGGSDVGFSIANATGGQNTGSYFSDSLDHQLRAGVRLNIY